MIDNGKIIVCHELNLTIGPEVISVWEEYPENRSGQLTQNNERVHIEYKAAKDRRSLSLKERKVTQTPPTTPSGVKSHPTGLVITDLKMGKIG